MLLCIIIIYIVEIQVPTQYNLMTYIPFIYCVFNNLRSFIVYLLSIIILLLWKFRHWFASQKQLMLGIKLLIIKWVFNKNHGIL